MIRFDERTLVRRGEPEDLGALLAIKGALPMPRDPGTTRRGGFLLGNDPGYYADMLALGQVWVLEHDEPVGFALVLADPLLRASPLWERRSTIEWTEDFDPEPWFAHPIAYFDQLAVLSRVQLRYWGAALALRALAELLLVQRHALVLTTTVIEPIVNAAALPYLSRVGGRRVGRLAERYPGAGEIVSAVHVIEAQRCRAELDRLARVGGPALRRVLEAFSHG